MIDGAEEYRAEPGSERNAGSQTNDTSKTANITDTIFDRTYWYSPYKRRHFENQ